MLDEDYVVLRRGGDTDVLTRKDNLKKTIKLFCSKEYVVFLRRFYHVGMGKLLPSLEKVDLQFGGLNQNKLIFLDEKYFFNSNYSRKVVLNLALLLHLIVNKCFLTKKRKEQFYGGFNKLSKKEKKEFFIICKKEYGKKITRKIKRITEKKEVNIKRLKWQIIFKKSNLFQLIELPFVLISNQFYKFKQSRKRNIIVFLGVDGSGKTTSIKNLSKYLEKNNIKYQTGNLGVYHERTSFMNFLSKFIKKEKDEKKAQEKLNINYKRKSFSKNLIRIIDIYLRYKKILRKAKKNKARIILFDRYFYDLILQSKLDFFTRILLKIVPKPNKLFFLYSNPEEIYKRKGERNVGVLSEQIEKFKKEIKNIFEVDQIQTKTERQTLNEILHKLNNKDFLSCI